MTRIVGGSARGRRLAVPPRGTRPTSERAREALFNSLAALTDVFGAAVLDLFAGTGAVGLEALSRGAAAATFVENDRTAVEVLRRNVATLALPGAQVVRVAAASYLSALPPPRTPGTPGTPGGPPFDIVFADPPYALADAALAALLGELATPGWLAAEAIVVVERSARGAAPQWPDTIAAVKDRRYGEGVLWYGRSR